MKKTIALVLALVMTLSLLPMNVWATEGQTGTLTGNRSVGSYGVSVFTALDGNVLGYDSPVAFTGSDAAPKITISCGSSTSNKIYLGVREYDSLSVKDSANASVTIGDLVGTWYDTYDNCLLNVYELAMPTKPTNAKVVEYTIPRGDKTLALVFDFSLKAYWSYNVQNDGWSNGTLQNTPGGSNLLYLATDNTGTPLGAGTWTASASSAGIGSVGISGGNLYWDRSDVTKVKTGNKGTITISNGTTSYDISVSIGEPEIHVYTAKSGDTYSGELFANADNKYMYTSGSELKVYFVARDGNIKITSVAGTSYPDGVGEAVFTIPANDSGHKEFSVAFTSTWQESDGTHTRNVNMGYRFFDTNDTSPLFCRAIWGSNKDSWNNSRFPLNANDQMTLEFALPPQNGGRPSDSAVMPLEDAEVVLECSNSTGEKPRNLGTFVGIENNRVILDCRAAIPGSKGVLKLTTGGTTYTVPVEISPAFVGVYSGEPDNSDLGKNYMTRDSSGHYTYTPGAQSDQVFYIFVNGNVNVKTTGQPTGVTVVNTKLVKYKIPADTYGNQRVTIQMDGDPSSWEINFKEAERHNTVVGSDGLTADDKAYGPVPIGDTGYFIAPIGYLYGAIRALGGGWQSFSEEGQIESAVAVGFWKMGADGVTYELLEGEELAAVAAKFNEPGTTDTTLEMSIKLAAKSNAENTEYPFARKISPTNDVDYHKLFVSPYAYPLAKIYQFNKNSRGVWIYEVTGTYTDGEKTFNVTAYGRDEKRTEKQDSFQIPAQSTPEATVAYINNFLQEYAGSSSEYNAIHLDVGLPAGELKGYIKVPAKNYNVFFYGAMDDDGDILTTLEGGIIANNADTRTSNVRFVGAGRGEKDWSNAENWNGSKAPNKAFYGEAGGGVYHCSFIGYDCAIEMNGGVIGAGGNTGYDGFPVGDTGCFFYNNEVAIKVNIPDGSDFMGDSQYWKMVMVNNGTDFDFEDVGDGSGYWVNISRSIFVRNDNKNSIHNTGGRTFFMPKCAFYNTANENTSGNHDPKVDGNVSIAPYYTLTDAGKAALITSLNVEEMLAKPIYKEEWISAERLFPRSWICPANPDKAIYSVPSDNITSEPMNIDIVDNSNGDEYVGTITLKKAN